ncbi:UDP-glucose 4-epimerase GalE [Henriciella sp.]|uniref:UDP-glucose 4-epimerase GalE n=1 Tax=Henriciella sp. TaxID=1968823 RepID=UPI00262446FD|nr:UDP-glucose 4-epimerase GalE [Henriciella sp.]
MTRTVLVTGGAGYVGSHCCKAFRDAGWKVVVFDNFSRGWRDFVQFGESVEGDLLSPADLDAAFDRYKPDAVAHFAAFAYVGESVEKPGLYYENNTLGTMRLLDAMAKAGCGRIIFSSTCATYGVPESMPITEDLPQAPINPYGRSKLFVEKVLEDYETAHGIRAVKLRYFNAAGASPDGEIGERHEPETHLIPLCIEGVLNDTFKLTVFGDDFDTRDGTCIRDYIHVMDLADAHLRALDYLDEGGASEAFNLGTGTGTTVMEIVNAVERVTGKPVPRSIGPRRPGDPPALVASAEKAESILGWKPVQSDVDSLIRTAYDWHRKEIARKVASE